MYTGLDTELKNYENIDRKINLESIIKWTPSDTKINFAKYLVALATLNPNIIDREKTYNLGELTLKDGIDNFSIKTIQKIKVLWIF